MGYGSSDGGDKDARDSIQMRLEQRLRDGQEDGSVIGRHVGTFERHTKVSAAQPTDTSVFLLQEACLPSFFLFPSLPSSLPLSLTSCEAGSPYVAQPDLELKSFCLCLPSDEICTTLSNLSHFS